MDTDESIAFMNSERQRFFLFLFSWDNLKVCNERRHSIAILECISEPKLYSNLAHCVRYTSSFVFRLIYFTARNVKEMLFEKFAQCDVEMFSFSQPRLMRRKNDLRFSYSGIIIHIISNEESGCNGIIKQKNRNRCQLVVSAIPAFYAEPHDFFCGAAPMCSRIHVIPFLVISPRPHGSITRTNQISRSFMHRLLRYSRSPVIVTRLSSIYEQDRTRSDNAVDSERLEF